jgi:hypothetical protein
MEVDRPTDMFPFDGLQSVKNAKPQASTGPQLSKEEQELKDLAAYFPAYRPGHEVNFTDLLGYGGEGNGGNANQYYEEMTADQGRRRKIVDLDGEFGCSNIAVCSNTSRTSHFDTTRRRRRPGGCVKRRSSNKEAHCGLVNSHHKT